MKLRDVAGWRMHNLGLSASPSASVEDVVGHLGAVQSQNFGPGKWSIAQRTKDSRDADVSLAFDAGRIVRTHVLRPTWHFVLATDIRWMLQLTGPRVQAKTAGRLRQLGLDDDLLERCRRLLTDALQGGRQLTRPAIRTLFQAEGVPLEDNRLAHILGDAELRGLICSGCVEGKQQTFALLEERCAEARTLSQDEALTELVARYFSSHGPATLKDFSWWSGLTMTQIRRGLEMVPEIEQVEVEGLSFFVIGPHPANESSGRTCHLLQTFDEYVVGYTESRHVMDIADSGGPLPNLVPGVIVLDTQVIGTWSRKIHKDEVVIEATLLRRLKRSETEALREETERFGRFVGLQARLEVAN